MSTIEALSQRVADLEAENKGLRERVAQLEEVKKASLNAITAAVGAVKQLSPLAVGAATTLQDEAWALDAAVTIHPAAGSESIHSTTWTARYWDGVRTLEESAPTIAAALRALRAKVREVSR